MQDYLKSTRKPQRVISALEGYLAVRELDTSRRQDVLHPSEIVKDDWCIREAWHRIKNARQGILPDMERPGLRLQTVFDVGHAAHARWQEYLGQTGHLWGGWKCRLCGFVLTNQTVPQESCPKCGRRPSWEYQEVGLHHGLISGHTDGWLVWPDSASLLEIKTIGSGTIRTYDPALLAANDGDLEKAFNNIRRPFKDHRRQAMTYLRLAHEMFDAGEISQTPPQDAIFLYENKANQSVKEFTMEYDPSLVDDVWEADDDLQWYLDHDREPACDHSAARYGSCKKCKVYDEE